MEHTQRKRTTATFHESGLKGGVTTKQKQIVTPIISMMAKNSKRMPLQSNSRVISISKNPPMVNKIMSVFKNPPIENKLSNAHNALNTQKSASPLTYSKALARTRHSSLSSIHCDKVGSSDLQSLETSNVIPEAGYPESLVNQIRCANKEPILQNFTEILQSTMLRTKRIHNILQQIKPRYAPRNTNLEQCLSPNNTLNTSGILHDDVKAIKPVNNDINIQKVYNNIKSLNKYICKYKLNMPEGTIDAKSMVKFPHTDNIKIYNQYIKLTKSIHTAGLNTALSVQRGPYLML